MNSNAVSSGRVLIADLLSQAMVPSTSCPQGIAQCPEVGNAVDTTAVGGPGFFRAARED